MVFRKFAKKLRSICLGWFTLLSGRTPEWAKDRLMTCYSCPSNKFWVCTECGCPLHAKARSEEETCPHPTGDKWEVSKKSSRKTW